MTKVLKHICILFFIGLTCCTNTNKKAIHQNSNGVIKDSILNLIKSAKDKKNLNQKKDAKLALDLAIKHKNDSLYFLALHRLSIVNYRLKKYSEFKNNADLYLLKANQVNDSIQMAKGHYKLGSFYFKKMTYDSAFFHFNQAKEIFKKQKDSLRAGSNLLNMAIIQNRMGDYSGSENTSVEALTFLDTIKSKKNIVSLYNNLGITSNELEQYKEAIYWYKKSLLLITKNKEKIVLYNNIGIVYRNQKEYKKALDFFQKALDNIEIEKYPSHKAMIIDNIGYLYFLMKNKNALSFLKNGLEIRKREKSKRGVIVSHLHLGEYFLNQKNNNTANLFFKRALEESIQLKDVKNKLKALLFLSKVASNNRYIYNYISLNDSIVKAQQVLKNKFAKIKYRTKEQEINNIKLQQENLKNENLLEEQRNKTIFYVSLSLCFLGLIILGIYYFKQKQRTQRQQSIIEKLKAKTEEKQQISMYLHDDIASDLLIGLQKADQLQREIKSNSLEQILKFFERAYNKMRNISQKMSTPDFTKISFDKRIDILCKEYSFNGDFKIIHLGLDSISWNLIEDEIKNSLLYIIQEAFNNMMKHSKASEGSLEFSNHKKELLLFIRDNGIGIVSKTQKGIGLSNIEKRVNELGGDFTILKSKGTELKIVIPKKPI